MICRLLGLLILAAVHIVVGLIEAAGLVKVVEAALPVLVELTKLPGLTELVEAIHGVAVGLFANAYDNIGMIEMMNGNLDGAEDNYHIQLLKAPEGYSFDPDFEFYTGKKYGQWRLLIRKDS